MEWLIWGAEFAGTTAVEIRLDPLPDSIKEEILDDLGALIGWPCTTATETGECSRLVLSIPTSRSRTCRPLRWHPLHP